jgi:hypothetical protein
MEDQMAKKAALLVASLCACGLGACDASATSSAATQERLASGSGADYSMPAHAWPSIMTALALVDGQSPSPIDTSQFASRASRKPPPPGAPKFILVWNGKPFTYGNTGETRTITVENTGEEGKVTPPIKITENKPGFITIAKAEIEACEKMTYEAAFPLNQCPMTVTYNKKSACNEGAAIFEVEVEPGIAPKNKVTLNG